MWEVQEVPKNFYLTFCNTAGGRTEPYYPLKHPTDWGTINGPITHDGHRALLDAASNLVPQDSQPFCGVWSPISTPPPGGGTPPTTPPGSSPVLPGKPSLPLQPTVPDKSTAINLHIPDADQSGGLCSRLPIPGEIRYVYADYAETSNRPYRLDRKRDRRLLRDSAVVRAIQMPLGLNPELKQTHP